VWGVSADVAVSGQHLCALYRDERKLAGVAAAFVGDGLAACDRVLYLTSERSAAEVHDALGAAGLPVDEAVRSGQLVLRHWAEHYPASAAPADVRSAVAGFREEARQCLADGFAGLRIAVEMGGFQRDLGSPDRLLDWERTAGESEHEAAISAVCQYDRRALDHRTAAALVAAHDGVADPAAPRPPAQFLALGRPFGLRVVGEVDASNHIAFRRALAARLLVQPRIVVDVSRMTFVDAAGIGQLYCLAELLPAGGVVWLVGLPPRLEQLLRLSGEHPRLGIGAAPAV
jgi:anti-anti-sigma factor